MPGHPGMQFLVPFVAQSIILSAQKAPAGGFSSSKYNFICPKGPCGMIFRFKIQFYPPKGPLRDAFVAKNTILSAQKAPAGRISSPKYNFINAKAPCGTLFYPKLQFYPPKRPLRDAFLTQNTILSTKKASAGRFWDFF